MNTTSPVVRPRKSALGLTLRAFMILILLIGGVMGWIAYRARVQRNAVAAIRKAGGSVLYNGEIPFPAGRNKPKPAAKGPKWLRDALGNDVFDSVTSVTIPKVPIDDRLMAHIGELRGLEYLNLDVPVSSPLTSAGYSQIQYLKQLKSLIISSPKRSDGFLPYIGPQKQLRQLMIRYASARDDDLARIGKFTELGDLTLGAGNVTDKGFAQLANLRKLSGIELYGCAITNIAPVRDMAQINYLRIHNAKPSSPNAAAKSLSFEPLRGKDKLRSLFLQNLPTDDENLKVLATLPALGGCWISGRNITEKGLATLCSAPKFVVVDLQDTSIRDLRSVAPQIAKIRQIGFDGSQITDDGLSPLANMSHITGVDLSRTKITDKAMAHLVGLTNLVGLQLAGTQVTDTGLAQLSGLTKLRILDLRDMPITGSGLAQWTGMNQLNLVRLDKSQIAEGGLAFVSRFRRLSRLYLADTSITDAGLARLKPARGLVLLDLNRTKITDDGLKHLAGMTRLSELMLEETNISDAGLDHLAKIPSLTVLRIYGTRVTEAGLARLNAELPKLEIIREKVRDPE